MNNPLAIISTISISISLAGYAIGYAYLYLLKDTDDKS